MELRNLFDLKGLNIWLLASGIGLNGIWAMLILILSLQFLQAGPENAGNVQVGILIALFAGNFFTGWLLGKWAHDLRGPTYGLVGSFGSVGVILYALLPTGGVIGLMAALVALAGGFNGGVASLPRRRPPK